MIQTGDIITIYEYNFCNGATIGVAFDKCGLPIQCPLYDDCGLLVNVDDPIYLGEENITFDDQTPININAPTNTIEAQIQYKHENLTPVVEYNHVAFSTTNATVPSQNNGEIHTHLGTQKLTKTQLPNYRVIAGYSGTPSIHVKFYA